MCRLLRHLLELRQESSRLQCHPGVDDQRDRSQYRQCDNQRECIGVESNALTASLGTSTLTFGPYTLTLNVSS